MSGSFSKSLVFAILISEQLIVALCHSNCYESVFSLIILCLLEAAFIECILCYNSYR